jgi:hypothetical protein
LFFTGMEESQNFLQGLDLQSSHSVHREQWSELMLILKSIHQQIYVNIYRLHVIIQILQLLVSESKKHISHDLKVNPSEPVLLASHKIQLKSVLIYIHALGP